MATRYPTAELHGNIIDHDKRIGALEKNDVKQDERINNLTKDVDEICEKQERYEQWRDDVNKVLTQSTSAMNLGKWLLLAFGGSVIALIWSLITGQASIVFP